MPGLPAVPASQANAAPRDRTALVTPGQGPPGQGPPGQLEGLPADGDADAPQGPPPLPEWAGLPRMLPQWAGGAGSDSDGGDSDDS